MRMRSFYSLRALSFCVALNSCFFLGLNGEVERRKKRQERKGGSKKERSKERLSQGTREEPRSEDNRRKKGRSGYGHV